MDGLAKAINHFNVLLEDQNAKLDAVLEGIRDLPTRGEFNLLGQKVDKLSDDMVVVKAAVTANNRDVAELDHRVTRLEAA